MILCIDCASTLCASGIDFTRALELSGLKKMEYNRKKQLFEKLLSLTKKINVNEICAQLELNDVIKSDVIALLAQYVKRKNFKDDINSAHCVAMAIYQAWKHRKQKGCGVKQRLIALSKLNSTKWKEFEAVWDKWIEQELPLKRNVKARAKAEQILVDCEGIQMCKRSFLKFIYSLKLFILFKDQSPSDEKENMSTPDGIELEPYEHWRDRMITIAKAELAKGNTHALFK